MTDSQPEPSSSSSTSKVAQASTSTGNDNDTTTNTRRRLSRRSDRPSPMTSPNRRRSSMLSYGSIDDVTASLHEDILQPASRKRRTQDTEHSHWDSTPLAFAVLPALAGILFTNGSAFVTDVLLLTFAAVFLNWSIRVPREWYYSAQAVRQNIEPDDLDEDESAVEDTDDTPKPTPGHEETDPIRYGARQAAADQLKTQETMALLATFAFPAMAAYLLHVIRAQLSLPSTSLVSDYNISIFLLAAEFWPARQVIRLVAARTLHLQRTASGHDDPFADSLVKGSDNTELQARIAALEAKLEEAALTSSASQGLQPADLSSLDARIQKRLEPRLDSLERAVRRYEKRYTTLAMVSEQRFQNLETRLQDALSLAAVAAQQGQRPSIVSTVLDTSVDIALLPAKLTWELIVWPYKILDDVYDRIKVILLGPQSSKYYAARRKTTKNISDVKIKDDKIVREKQTRKIVR